MSIIGPRASLASNLIHIKMMRLKKMSKTRYHWLHRLTIGMDYPIGKRVKDAWYANNVSFWLDVKIFFKTIVTTKARRIYTQNEKQKQNNI